jgi:C-terminal processing protease CtpA/Prc
MSRNKAFIVILGILFSISTYGQSKLKYQNSFFCDSTLFSWRPGLEKKGKVKKRFFPSYYSYLSNKNVVLKSVRYKENNIFNNLENVYGISISTNIKLYQKDRDSSLNAVLNRNLYLQFQLFSNHVDSIDVWYEIKEINKWYNVGKFKLLKGQTYQPLMIVALNIDSLILKNKENNTLTIGQINVLGIEENKTIPEMYFGEISLKNRYFLNYDVDYDSTSVSRINWNTTINVGEKSSILLKMPDVISRYGQRPNVKLLMNDSLTEQEKIIYVSQYIHQILINYPHYSIKGISKDSILNEHLHIIKSATSLNQYYINIDKLISSLQNIHFHIINIKKKNNGVLPLLFSLINNEIQVVGVFDTTLLNKVSLGDKLIEINQVPIDFLLKELKSEVVASTNQGYNKKIIQQLLNLSFNYFHRSLVLKFSNSKIGLINLDSNSIFKNKNIYIPPNYKSSKSLAYRKIKNYSYIKIGEFSEVLLNPFIYSYIDSIKSCNGIIFDLRGNGSGDNSVATIMSLFIKKTTPILVTPIENIDPYNYTGGTDTLYAKPFFYNCTKPIIFLVDAKTTCASELLISNLKKIKEDVWIIGETPTAGSAELAYTIELPETKGFKGNLVYYSRSLYNGFNENIDLNGGLNPDIKIAFNSYKDLAPFDDTILKTAVMFFDNLKTK